MVTRPSPSRSHSSSLKVWKRGGGPFGEVHLERGAFKAPFPMRFLSEAVGQMRRPGGQNAITWCEEQRCTPHPPMRLPIEPRANGTEALGALSACGGVPSGSSGSCRHLWILGEAQAKHGGKVGTLAIGHHRRVRHPSACGGAAHGPPVARLLAPPSANARSCQRITAGFWRRRRSAERPDIIKGSVCWLRCFGASCPARREPPCAPPSTRGGACEGRDSGSEKAPPAPARRALVLSPRDEVYHRLGDRAAGFQARQAGAR